MSYNCNRKCTFYQQSSVHFKSIQEESVIEISVAIKQYQNFNLLFIGEPNLFFFKIKKKKKKKFFYFKMSTTAVKVTAAQLARIPQPLLLKVTLVKSAIRTNPKVRKNLTALGLNKINKTMIHKNVRPIRGMINAVCPLSNF